MACCPVHERLEHYEWRKRIERFNELHPKQKDKFLLKLSEYA